MPDRKHSPLQRSRSRPGLSVPSRFFESLEARQLLSGGMTADEVYLSELINRARMDPAAEAARLGFDLTDGLTEDELALFGPVEPLALDLTLAAAARAHSLDMADRGFFDHINPDGLNPTQRARAAGYGGVAGESIGAAHNSVDALYEAWMYTPENRINILSLFTSFDESFHYDQLGVGFALDNPSAEDHYTVLFGDPGTGSTARLLGVVYTDTDQDEFYTSGEGLGNVRIDVADAGAPETVVATFTTDALGNYQIELGDGSWIVTFTDTATGLLVEKSVTTAGENVKVDTTADELHDPPIDDGGDGGGDSGGGDNGGDGGSGDGGDGGDGGGGDGDGGGGDGGGDNGSDDHADDGDYPNATLTLLDADHQGRDSGVVDTPTDTDLFYFTADISGELTLVLDATGSTLRGALTLQSDAGLPLVAETASDAGGTLTLVWNVAGDRQYFVVVAAAEQGSTGAYQFTIEIAAPGEDNSDDGDGGNDGGGDGGGGGGGGGDGGDNGSGGDDGNGDDGNGNDGNGNDGNGDGSGDGDNPPDEDNPPVDATSDSAGNFTVVRTDSNGRPILYLEQADGSWQRVDLVGEAGGPTPEGRFSTFLDPSTGRSSIVSATTAGLAIYDQDDAGVWSVRNLSTELDAAPIASKPVTFTTRTGLIYTAGLDADGNLVTYRYTGEDDANGRPAWGFEDISAEDLAPQGLELPELVGSSLIAYVTGWNALTIAGLDSEGNVYAAWWAPGLELWRSSNLSAITGAPKYEGTISAYLTPWNGINIAGTDVNGDLSVVWWVPSFGGRWQLTKLNQVLDGPDLLEGTIASWVTPWGGLNISGLTAAGKVVVYWWTPTSGAWDITTLSDFIPDVEPPAQGVVGHTSNQGVISIMGLSDAGDLVRYWWEAGEPWRGENLGV
ncbi:MAG: CAP domain-containing protein [Planctomycetota bacterium]|nr:CAP domain-containing protein [Planctomycetota bacterium]